MQLYVSHLQNGTHPCERKCQFVQAEASPLLRGNGSALLLLLTLIRGVLRYLSNAQTHLHHPKT